MENINKIYDKLKFICQILVIFILFCFIILTFKNVCYYYKTFRMNNTGFSFSIFKKAMTNDVFFTIANGKEIVKNGFQEYDHLTWHKNLKFTNSRWLFDIILFKIYTNFEFEGINVFTSVFTILIAFTLFYIYQKKTKNVFFSIISTLILIYLSKNAFLQRAQIVSFLLFMLEYILLESLFENFAKIKAIVIFLIGILIANIHASVYPIFLIIFLPFLAEIIIEKTKNQKIFKNKIVLEKTEKPKEFLSLFVVCFFSGLVSPIGLSPYTDMFNGFFGISSKIIGELEPSTIYNNVQIYIVIVVILTELVILNQIRLKDVLFLIGFSILSITSFRGQFFLLLIGGGIISDFSFKLLNKIDFFNNKKVTITIFILTSILISELYMTQVFFAHRYDYVPNEMYPVTICDYIVDNLNENNLRIYNGFNYGSYLEFRGIKSFIDSRSGMFSKEFNDVSILEDWYKAHTEEGTFKEILEKYDINYVITLNTDLENKYLENNNDWKVINKSENYKLYEKALQQ